MLYRLAALAVGLVVAGTAAGANVPDLRRGGLVVYLAQLGNGCSVDGTLAARLRADLQGLPVGRVVALRGCAARTTARLVFGRSAATRLSLARLLETPPRGRTNTVVVGPPSALARARGLAVARGEGWVFARRGEAVLRVRAGGWSAFLAPREPGRFREWDVAQASQVHPHDVWPAGDGTVWYTAQFRGAAGRLDIASGAYREIPLGSGSAPHGVVADAAGNAWITDQGLDAIVRVDRATEAVTVFPIPAPDSNPNTAAFAPDGVLWFTGAGGFYGRLDPRTGRVEAWPAPRGGGPYGITVTPQGDPYFVSLAGGYLGRIDPATGAVTVLDPPTRDSGTRRVWSDSRGRLWVTESFAGKLAMYDPAASAWREWSLPATGTGDRRGHPYAVCVDGADKVWLTDFSTNTLLRFDPETERWQAFPTPTEDALVRQIVAAGGRIWGAESATEKLVAFDAGS
jgi:virginiamycin B lyase